MEKLRRNYIDIVKAISIITLIYLHFEDGIVYKYNFFLVKSPAFYFVVGWLWGLSSKKRTIKEHLEKRKRTLIYPYFWFSLIILLFDVILVALNLQEPFLIWRDLYKTLILRGIGTLWFLPALLIGEIIFIYFRDKKILQRAIVIAVSTALVGAYYYWLEINYNPTTLSDIIKAPLTVIKDFLLCFIYINIAYEIAKRYGVMILNLSVIKKIIIGVTSVLFYFIASNFISPLLPHCISFWLVGILCNTMSLVGVFAICMLIENLVIIKPIVYFGRNSLILMATHFAILLEIFKLIDKHILHNNEFIGSQTIIYFAMAMLLEYFIIEFINKKAKFLIGK